MKIFKILSTSILVAMCTFGAIAEPSTTQPQKPKGKSGGAIVIPDIYSGESREVDLNCGQYNLTATNTERTSYAGMMEVDYY